MNAKPLKKKTRCDVPGCTETKEYDAAHLGIHKRAKHGIEGRSTNSVYARKQRAVKKAAAAQLKKTRKPYTKRSTKLAIIPKAPAQTNGHIQTNGATTRHFATEAAIAVAYDRYKELCKSVAFEYDLPPRSFAAQLSGLIHAATLR